MFYPHYSNIPLICPIYPISQQVPYSRFPFEAWRGGVDHHQWRGAVGQNAKFPHSGGPKYCWFSLKLRKRATRLWFEMMKYDITIYYMLINEHKSEMLKNHVGQNVCFLGWPSPPHPPTWSLRSLQRRWCWMTPAWFHDEKSTGTTSGIQRKIQRWQWKVRKKLRLSKDGRWW